jgi:nitrogen fixation/metabolism regulation signal transduction histidine kinase
MGSLFETLMLVCFGLSWPINMMKAYKARTAKGTSLPFLLLIITGYLGGIAAKIISGNINYVLVVYLINLAIVLLNLAVYFRNVSLDRKSEGKVNLVPVRA